MYELTGSALWVGVVDAIATLPLLFFSLFAGVVLDRFPKRDILRAAQFVQFAIGTTLGMLVLTDHASLFTIGLLGFLSGSVSAMDQPARMGLPIDLVGKRDLHAAFALNMSTVHMARIIGPAFGGFIIAGFGVGWAFLINGLTFLAPCITFSLIRFPPFVKRPRERIVSSITHGIHYVRRHTEIRLLLTYLSVFGLFGWSYTTMLPVFASEVFVLGPSGLGLLFSAAGAGTVLGGVLISALSRLPFNHHKIVLFGSLLFSSALFFFAIQPWYTVALLLLFCIGFGQAFQNSTVHTRVQMLCEDSMRGRVSSIQSVMLQGMQPIGSFQVGLIASYFGAQVAVALGAIIMFVSGIMLYQKLPNTAHSSRVFHRV